MGDNAAGDAKHLDDLIGALLVELVAGDESENLGESELDSGEILDGRRNKFRLFWMDPIVFGRGVAGGVVVVAEQISAQGG